jgi:hypothetical protein
MTKSTFNGVVLDASSLVTSNLEIATWFADCYEHRLVLIKSLKTGKITKAVMYIDGYVDEIHKGLALDSYLKFFTKHVKADRYGIGE